VAGAGIFNVENIEADLDTQKIGKHCLVFAEVDSTNDIALAVADDVKYDGLVIFADHQRTGRGRNGRSWVSHPGHSLLCSVLVFLRPCPTDRTAMVNIAASTAAVEALNDTFGIDAQIKWPNDIYCRGKKLGGILIESRAADNVGRGYVIGIGINVRQAQDQFPPELTDHAASIASLTGRPISDRQRLLLARRLLECLDRRIGQIENDRFDVLRKDYVAGACGTTEPVTIHHDRRQFHARVIDVDNELRLLVQMADGLMVHLEAHKATILL